jgi:glycosyltransferase involved in cell wall biosynthesis
MGRNFGPRAGTSGEDMKIALVCDWFYPRIGGIERHLAQLAQRFADAGHEATVLTPMPGATMPWSNVRLQHVPGRLLPGARLLCSSAGFQALGRLLADGHFDIVHAHGSIVSPAAFAAVGQAQMRRIPAVITIHSILGRYRWCFRSLDRLFYWSRWPVVFSGVSHRVAAEMQPMIASQPVVVLPNAIDPAEWALPLRPSTESIDIACVMRLARRKRGAALLHAFHRAISQWPDGGRVRLHLAGDGSDRSRLERLARRLGLSDQVEFHGAVTPAGVKQLLARSHFFVLPSRLEAFGIAALEARAAGLPIVGMRDSGLAEFVRHEREGLLAVDDADLADCLRRLGTDSALRAAITTHNRRTPVAFTWDRAIRDQFAVYDVARALVGETRPNAIERQRTDAAALNTAGPIGISSPNS